MLDLRFITCLVASLFLFAVSSETVAQENEFADFIVVGGKVITMDDERPEAEAIAILGDRILSLGTEAEMKKLVGPDTETIKLDEGQVVTPGLIEGHAHFVGLGESLMNLQLQRSPTWEHVVETAEYRAQSTKPGEWVVGRGWHQSKWKTPPEKSVQGYPTGESLNKVTPNHPVLLTHASGHMCFANEYAMRLAGVDESTKDPEGGEILRDENGKPTGVFRETAQALIVKAYERHQAKRSPELKRKHFKKIINYAQQECVSNGITSFQDAGSSFETIEFLENAVKAKQLKLRLWVMVRDSNDMLEAKLGSARKIGFANEFLTVRAVKRSIDGALGAHGAWLLAPYEDLPTSSGLNTASVESVTRTAEIALKHDFQVCVHAIGDRANREVLDIYEKLFKENEDKKDLRWRIEHAQHLHPDDIPRFGKLGVIASMQAVHCTSDAIFVPKRLGFRRAQQGAYVWKALLDSGAIVTNGTDAPVESINPLDSIYAAVTRRLNESFAFFPEQVMTRKQALKSYTIDAAYSAFEEDVKGSLVPGKLADMVVWDRNLLTCPVEDIRGAKISRVWVGGRLVVKRRWF